MISVVFRHNNQIVFFHMDPPIKLQEFPIGPDNGHFITFSIDFIIVFYGHFHFLAEIKPDFSPNTQKNKTWALLFVE